MLRARTLTPRAPVACFNPHRARRPGATAACRVRQVSPLRFNPHRARRPGATRGPWTSTTSSPSFNPHRARRPGATHARVAGTARVCVSILTGPGGPVLLLERSER